MSDDQRRRGPRPIPVTEAVRDLIRKTTADRPPEDTAAPGRTFVADGTEWIARIAGAGSAGTGSASPATIVAIRFFRGDDPERPRREALLPRGRFERLYDHELAALLQAARFIDTGADKG